QDQHVKDAEDDGKREKRYQAAGLAGAGNRYKKRSRHDVEAHSNLGWAREGLMELAAEFFKRAEHYSLPNPPHRVKVKVEIMQRVEGRSGHLADDKQVTQIRTRAMSARVAAAVGIGWQEVLGVAGILDGDRA